MSNIVQIMPILKSLKQLLKRMAVFGQRQTSIPTKNSTHPHSIGLPQIIMNSQQEIELTNVYEKESGTTRSLKYPTRLVFTLSKNQMNILMDAIMLSLSSKVSAESLSAILTANKFSVTIERRALPTMHMIVYDILLQCMDRAEHQ